MANIPLKDPVFPSQELKKLFSEYWDSKMQSPLKPPKVSVKGTVFALQPALSSQQAVGVLVSCKAVLGFRPSAKVIRKGGYISKLDFVMTSILAVEKEFIAKEGTRSAPAREKGRDLDAAIAV